MAKTKGFLAWLPQGTKVWDYEAGVSDELSLPGIYLVLDCEANDNDTYKWTYEVFYRGSLWNVSKNHVTIIKGGG